MSAGRIGALMPVEWIDVTVKFSDPDVAERLKEKIASPGVSSGFIGVSRPLTDEVSVTCKDWVNVDQLKRLSDAATMDIYKEKFKKI